MAKQRNNFQDEAESREFRKGEESQKEKDYKARFKTKNGSTRKNISNSSGSGSNRKPNPSRNAGRNGKRGGNPVEDHAFSSTLLNNWGSVSFGNAIGAPIQLWNRNPNAHGAVVTNPSQYAPGILTYKIAPSVGHATSGDDPITQAGRYLMAFLRRGRSGVAPYQPADLMMHLISIAQVDAFILFMKRAYGIANSQNYLNKYIPKALLNAQNIDYDDLIMHMSDYVGYVNFLITKVNAYFVPNNMPYFSYYGSLFNNVYIESESIKDQMYQYTPWSFWQYREDVGETSGDVTTTLQPMMITGSARMMTAQDLFQFGLELLEPIMTSESAVQMQSDLRNAFGEAGLEHPAYIDSAYTVDPVNNYAVLEQMKNASILSTLRTLYGFTAPAVSQVTQVNNSYILSPQQVIVSDSGSQYANQAAVAAVLNRALIMSTIVPNPDASVVMEDTRLMADIDVDFTSDGDMLTINVESSSVLVMEAVISVKEPGGTVKLLSVPDVALFGSTVSINNVDLFQTFTYLRSFKFSPKVFSGLMSQDGKATMNPMVWDFDNYAVIDGSILRNLNLLDFWTLFNIPNVTVATAMKRGTQMSDVQK